MPVSEIGDPRLQALFGTNDPRDVGVRPTVRLPRKGLPPIALAAVAVVFGVLLFSLLNAHRTRSAEPSVIARVPETQGGPWIAPPPLYVPPVPQTMAAPPPVLQQQRPAIMPPSAAVASPHVVAAPLPAPVVQVVPSSPPQLQPPPQHVSSGSPLVIDTSSGGAAGAPAPTSGGGAPSDADAAPTVVRMRASAFANRSMTVPQGYLIPAVLETGFDSTRPGFARAVVSRDVRGFDGKNVLIPRGSRLVGSYKSTIAHGQNRAVISWTRLMRPDGMTITLDSPAVDPMGRGGLPATVNTHFLARLGNALLQTTMALGQSIAGRSVTGPVVVVQGNATAAAAQLAAPVTDYTPTLTVKPGKSISIFVAQDLDFSGAGTGR